MTHIYKIANGSLSTAIGDTRLYYTGNYSERARAINGIFLDNPPVLSPDYATLVWRYNNDTDRYMLIHVQGSQVVDTSQGRNYPYRAAFEVSRDDVNALATNDHLPLSSLFTHMPRIEQYTSTSRVTEQHEVAKVLSPVTTEARNLAARIISAFTNAEPLYITISTSGRQMNSNGVFSAPELQTLLTAIEQLPLSLARYATFTFCADQYSAAVMDNILINIIAEGAKIQIPKGCRVISWAEAIMPHAIDAKLLNTIFTVADALPGSVSPMAPVNEASAKFNNDVKRFNLITAKKPADVATDEWDTWLIRHDINEINITSWDEYIAMSTHMPESHLSTLATNHHADALQWPSDDRMYDHTDTFGFSNSELVSKLSIEQLIKLNRSILIHNGEKIEKENILTLYTPQIIANGIACHKVLSQGPLDATEKLLSQCIELKQLRKRKDYAFDVLYYGVVGYLCDKYANITSIDTWGTIIKEFWKMKVGEDGNKRKTLAYPLTHETLKVVFQSRINVMTDNQLSRFTTEVINQYHTTKDKGILALVKVLHSALK